MSFLAGPRTRGNSGPPGLPPAKDAAPQWPGRGPRPEAAAPGPAPPRPPAPQSAPARPRRPPGGASVSGPAPGPAPLTRGTAVRTHLRSRPLPGHPQRRRGRSPLGQRGGRGRRARAATAPAARPSSGKASARLREPGQLSAPEAGPEPAVPARPLALGRPPPRTAPRRPAQPLRRSPLSLSAPCAAPGRSCRKRRRPVPPGEGQTAHPPRRQALPAAPPGERKPRARAGGGGGA